MFRNAFAVPALFLSCLMSSPPQAADAESSHHENLTEVVIRGAPLLGSPLESTQPTTVLRGEDLVRRVGTSLGETVASQPGVSSTYYGPVASRPIIRGLGGYRVQMLDDGLSSMDASNVSEDHAVTIEPALAQQIEILRGPAALLYGSGGAGGVVNVVSARLPNTRPAEPLTGSLELRGSSALAERATVGQLNANLGALLLHLDGYRRVTNDVHIAGAAVSDRLRQQLEAAGAEVADARDRVANSASDTWGASAGGTYFARSGSLGFAYDHRDTVYGLPTEEQAFIDMKQNRLDMKGRIDLHGGILQSLTLRGGFNDYTHTEFEAPGVPGTLFNNRTYELRTTADHSLRAGWRGAAGVQFAHQDFEAVGAEAYVPPAITRTLGLFLFEERKLGDWTLEGGARFDSQKITPDALSALPDYDSNALNLSAGAIWKFSELDLLALNFTRTQRHPQATELYADGFHAALRRVEIGDPALHKETGYTLDAALRRVTGPLQWSIGAFYNRYSDFIFIEPTGAVDPDEGASIFAYTQEDADLYGMEAQVSFPFSTWPIGQLQLRLTGDYLRGETRDGNNLPSIPPYRLGVGLDFDRGGLHLGLEAQHSAAQDDVAGNELPTDDYTLLSADASYRWELARGDLFVFLRGSNLLDEEARQHSSPLKDIVPLPGRGLHAGLRMQF